MRVWEFTGFENVDQGAHYGAIVAADSNIGSMAQNADGADQWEAIGHTSGHAIYCILCGHVIAAFSENVDGDFYPGDVAEEMARQLVEILETPNAPIPHPADLFRLSADAGNHGGGFRYKDTGAEGSTADNGMYLVLPVTDFPAKSVPEMSA